MILTLYAEFRSQILQNFEYIFLIWCYSNHLSRLRSISEMEFPYHHKFLPSASEMFKKLQLFANTPSNHTFKPSYSCLNVLYRSYPDQFNESDSLSDHFSESARMMAIFQPRQFKSPMETWNSWSSEFKKSKTEIELRDELYFKSGMANGFNPCILIQLIKHYNIKSVFDPCMGWGDRLIAGLASSLDRYVGFDTNPDLTPVYDQIVATLSESVSESVPIQYTGHCNAIELAPVEWLEQGGQYYEQFDCMATSPPFFDLEIYQGALTSTTLYKTKDEWMKLFYYEMLRRSLQSVKPEGYLFLYLPYQMGEDAKKFLVSKMKATFVGVVGFYQTDGKRMKPERIRETYVFRK